MAIVGSILQSRYVIYLWDNINCCGYPFFIFLCSSHTIRWSHCGQLSESFYKISDRNSSSRRGIPLLKVSIEICQKFHMLGDSIHGGGDRVTRSHDHNCPIERKNSLFVQQSKKKKKNCAQLIEK